MTLDLREIREIVNRVFAREDVLNACQERRLGPILDVLSHHGISQSQITGLTGIPQGRLSEYKRGKRVPTLNTLEAFANGLGVPEEARCALGLAPSREADSRATPATAAEPSGSAMPDLLTVAWMADSLNNHVDRRAVLQLAMTLIAAPLLGVEEPHGAPWLRPDGANRLAGRHPRVP